MLPWRKQKRGNKQRVESNNRKKGKKVKKMRKMTMMISQCRCQWEAAWTMDKIEMTMTITALVGRMMTDKGKTTQRRKMMISGEGSRIIT
jgi:hypothetical protein